MVATPIGNLEDITLRALRILREADIIACEDTRHTQKLLAHYEIKKRLASYHEHNETARARGTCARNGARRARRAGERRGNAGHFRSRIANWCRRALLLEFLWTTIPGASALTTAIAGAGLPSESVWFLGFLPSRTGERRKVLRALSEMRFSESVAAPTLVFYEAPHRIKKTIADCAEIFGARQAVIARELTKIHEEFLRGSLIELAERINENPLRGEITVLIAPGDPAQPGNAPDTGRPSTASK